MNVVLSNTPIIPDAPVTAEYVWVGGGGSDSDLRSKTRVLDHMPAAPSDVPEWNFDGSSTGQAPGNDSEVTLRPVAIFADPFAVAVAVPSNGNRNVVRGVLVLCECVLPDGRPAASNHRTTCHERMQECAAHAPWFGIEQEYTLFESDGHTPLGWPHGGFPRPQGPYYCGVGTDRAYGRRIKDAHCRACLAAGVKLCGTNAEVMPSQWEYQIGPCQGIDAGDHLLMSRYIMHRVCEDHGVVCSFDPKPVDGDWNGAGCHVNYSTASMRGDDNDNNDGMKAVLSAISRMAMRHTEHMRVYGSGNERRMTGLHETASYDAFSYGVADRGASVRIPRATETAKRGYLEDRRPASNADPYAVTGELVYTTLLWQAPVSMQ